MAISIMGYPMTTYYCPNCGSQNIKADDHFNGTGQCKCNDCDKVCIIIESEEGSGQ